MTCDGLELSATSLALELTTATPALSLSASIPSLSLEAGDCALTLSIDSTLDFSVVTQELELKSDTIELCFTTPIPMSTGEANTASNCGVDGAGLFHQKQGVDLEFRNIRSTNSGIVVAVNAPDCTVDLTLDETALNRFNVVPAGDRDGVNLDYTFIENVLPSTFRLYRNGVRQKQDALGTCDFTLSESGGVGTGYDTVEITTPALLSWEQLTADYVIAT